MIFVNRVLLVRIFEQAAINQRCKGYCGKTLKICFYHSRPRKLFSQRYHLCWAENISDRVPCKLFVLDRAPQINNFFLTDIDAELGAENHLLWNKQQSFTLFPGRSWSSPRTCLWHIHSLYTSFLSPSFNTLIKNCLKVHLVPLFLRLCFGLGPSWEMVRKDEASKKNELFQMSKLMIIDGSQNWSKLSMEESSPCCAAGRSDTWSERSLKRIFFRLLLRPLSNLMSPQNCCSLLISPVHMFTSSARLSQLFLLGYIRLFRRITLASINHLSKMEQLIIRITH